MCRPARAGRCANWSRTSGAGDRWAATIVARAGRDLRRHPHRGRRPRRRRARTGWPTGCAPAPPSCSTRWPATGADTPVWTFIGPQPAAWWIRRRLHEATVHRRGRGARRRRATYELPAELAADGLSEWLDLVAARPVGVGAGPAGRRRRRCTCTPPTRASGSAGEWLVRGEADGVELGARAREGPGRGARHARSTCCWRRCAASRPTTGSRGARRRDDLADLAGPDLASRADRLLERTGF